MPLPIRHLYKIGKLCVLLSHYFQLHSLYWFERDAVDGLALGVVGHRRIDLSCRDVLVAEHVLDGIDTCACIHL